MKPGPKTALNKKLFAKLKEAMLEGKTLRDFAKDNKIPESTVYTWSFDNYQNFADKVRVWQLQYKLKKAESRADEILSLPIHDKDNKVDSAVLRTIQKEAEFIRKTLAKEVYSERKELTGENGGPVTIKWQTDADDNDTVQTENVGETTTQLD